MAAFKGEFEHQLDAKNRIRIPAKFRDVLGPKFVLGRGMNNCIAVYSLAKFEQLSEQVEAIDDFDISKKKSARDFFRSAYDVEEDAQNRIILPAFLIKHAKIEKDIMILGAGSYIEIWSKEHYEEYYGSDEDFDEQMSKLKKEN